MRALLHCKNWLSDGPIPAIPNAEEEFVNL